MKQIQSLVNDWISQRGEVSQRLMGSLFIELFDPVFRDLFNLFINAAIRNIQNLSDDWWMGFGQNARMVLDDKRWTDLHKNTWMMPQVPSAYRE